MDPEVLNFATSYYHIPWVDCKLKYNNCLNISGWRDVDQTLPRSEGKLKILEELFTQVKQLRPADAPVIKGKSLLCYIPFNNNRLVSAGTAVQSEQSLLHVSIKVIFEPPRGKTNNVVSEQVRHKPACTSTEKS